MKEKSSKDSTQIDPDSPEVRRLVSKVAAIVEESGVPGIPFNASQWTQQWLDTPCPALGFRKPAEYLHSAEGTQRIEDLLGQIQSGAYA